MAAASTSAAVKRAACSVRPLAGPSTAAHQQQPAQRRLSQRAYDKSNADIAGTRRHLHASRASLAPLSFDTSTLVARLEDQGLSRTQAQGVMEALEEVVEESVRTMTGSLVTRAEQEKHQYTQKVDFAKLKSEITLLEKQDFSLLKSENERLLSEVEKLKQQLRENITRTQAGVRLDLNLEKGRIRDELSARDLKLKEVDTRIESEINNLRASMESVKFSILQYVVGSLTGTGALLLAYLRLFS